MSYQELYKSKLVSAEKAVSVIKSGDWVDYSWCINHPIELDKALAARQNELFDVKIRGGVTMWMPEIAKALNKQDSDQSSRTERVLLGDPKGRLSLR